MMGEDIQVFQNKREFKNAETILGAFRDSGADVLVVGTLPATMLLRLWETGVPFLWTVGDHDKDKRRWRFVRFEWFHSYRLLNRNQKKMLCLA